MTLTPAQTETLLDILHELAQDLETVRDESVTHNERLVDVWGLIALLETKDDPQEAVKQCPVCKGVLGDLGEFIGKCGACYVRHNEMLYYKD